MHLIRPSVHVGVCFETAVDVICIVFLPFAFQDSAETAIPKCIVLPTFNRTPINVRSVGVPESRARFANTETIGIR